MKDLNQIMAWYSWGIQHFLSPSAATALGWQSDRRVEAEGQFWNVLQLYWCVWFRSLIDCCFSLLSPTLLFSFFSLSMSSLLSSPPFPALLSLSAPVVGTPCRARGQDRGALPRGCRSGPAGWELPARRSRSSGAPGHWWDCPGQSRTIVSSAGCHRGTVLFGKRAAFWTGTILKNWYDEK